MSPLTNRIRYTNEFAFIEDVPFHGLKKLILGQASLYLQFGVESVYFEVIVVDAVAFKGMGLPCPSCRNRFRPRGLCVACETSMSFIQVECQG